MVKEFEKVRNGPNNIKADIIILGCSLPGIVTAHKLKKTFGDSMDIVVLDLKGPTRALSRYNVTFKQEQFKEEQEDETEGQVRPPEKVSKRYLTSYAKDFHIPVPDDIIDPQSARIPLNKLFQHRNGSTIQCTKDYHDFDYLSVLEKFELNQYQAMLDRNTRNLFHSNDTKSNRKTLLYYDQTTMEYHICHFLYFTTCREIMRTTVKLVCGVSASKVSVLFYLHQCYRADSSKNHLDGQNTNLREKLMGYFRKRLARKLQQSVADITMPTKPIKEIRTNSDEQLILETMMGDTNYVCNLLAMALRPDELSEIQVEAQLITEAQVKITKGMVPGRGKKFYVQYEESFWRKSGFSGDIFSIRGPILWAMERPKVSTIDSERYSALIGYLVVKDDNENSQEAVLEQLVKLFGEEAAEPISYRESDISDIFVPLCGDYVPYRDWIQNINLDSKFGMQWGTLDVFGDGDVAGALEAGHITYLQLLSYLRPQALTFEDLSLVTWTTIVKDNPIERLWSYINYMTSTRFVMYIAVAYLGLRLLRTFRTGN